MALFCIHFWDSFVRHTFPGQQYLSQPFEGDIPVTSTFSVIVSSNNCYLLVICLFCLILRSLLFSTALWQNVSWCGPFTDPGFIVFLSLRFVFHHFLKVLPFLSFSIAFLHFFPFFPLRTLIRLLLGFVILSSISFNMAFICYTFLFISNSR